MGRGGRRSPAAPSPTRVRADNPISRPEDDALGRDELARQFAADVLAIDASQGVVVGLYGRWGSGKTSLIGLARPDLQLGATQVIDFNPWLFSGTEQLADFFFSDLASQLKIGKNLDDIANSIADYGKAISSLAWVPVIGTWAARLGSIAKLVKVRPHDRGARANRDRVITALGKLEKPIVTIIDDVDRLSPKEVREIFRLVRLTASFPNIIYVLPIDRGPVEEALTDGGISGRNYLDKIIQLGVNLPEISRPTLAGMATRELNAAMEGVEVAELDESRFPDVLHDIILPLLRGPRDARRYAAAVATSARSIKGQIDLVDLLGMEAIRVLLPTVFEKLYSAAEALTKPAGGGWSSAHDDERHKQTISDLIAAAENQAPVARAMIVRLFPAAQRHLGNIQYGAEWERNWLREHRVASGDILHLYLERVPGDGARNLSDAECAWKLICEPSKLESFLNSLEPDRLQDVIASLELFEEDYRPEQAVPGSIVLLNLLPALPERSRGMFKMDPRFAITRVVLRLLRKSQGPTETEAAVNGILPNLKTLYAKFELLQLVGYRENAGQKLISEDAARSLDGQWRNELRTASPAELAVEHDLASMFTFARLDADPAEAPIEIADTPEVTFALLRSARNEVKSQGLDTRAMKRSTRLHWDGLVSLYGSEDILRQRLEALQATRYQTPPVCLPSRTNISQAGGRGASSTTKPSA